MTPHFYKKEIWKKKKTTTTTCPEMALSSDGEDTAERRGWLWKQSGPQVPSPHDWLWWQNDPLAVGAKIASDREMTSAVSPQASVDLSTRGLSALHQCIPAQAPHEAVLKVLMHHWCFTNMPSEIKILHLVMTINTFISWLEIIKERKRQIHVLSIKLFFSTSKN